MNISSSSAQSPLPVSPGQGRGLKVIGRQRKTVRRLSAITPQMRAIILSELRGGREVVAVAEVYQVREVIVLEILMRDVERRTKAAA